MRARATVSAVFLWALVFGLWSMLAQPAQAQQACEIVLGEAEKHYQAGQLDAVFAVEEACVEGKARRDQKIRAHELLANVYLALDEVDKAREHIAALLDLDFDFQGDRRDPALVRLVEEVRSAAAVTTVTSVSKSDEPLREAPATVVVLTAEEIERRGYLDLEAVLHDVPGFDISRSFGVPTYSSIYQRGLRSDFTNRTLFLIDGVEQNDLFTGTVYLSRQYPISAVERIEIIHGPASTMYGPNAFAGVINVITKRPEEMLAPGKSFGYEVNLVSGTYDTDFLEATVVGRSESANLSWFLSGRVFQSDEMDLSGFPEWDFDPSVFETINYRSVLRIGTEEGVANFKSFLNREGIQNCTGQPGCFFSIGEHAVELTDAGSQLAVALNKQLYLSDLGGQPVGFSNETKDWLVHGKLRFSDLEIGFQKWSRNEGSIASSTDRFAVGSKNGSVNIPVQTWIYARYAQRLSPALLLNFFSRFKMHDVDAATCAIFPIEYGTGSLGLESLVLRIPAYWQNSCIAITSTQLRNEISFDYQPSKRFHLVGGLELRNSTIPATFVVSEKPDAGATGKPALDIPGGNDLHIRDLGVYAQATYRPHKHLKILAGGRVDDNSARDLVGLEIPTIPRDHNVGGGSGTVFNPRLALISPWSHFVFKAIYSEAFQNPSNVQKFSVVPTQRFPHPELPSEKVENFELGFSWQPNENFLLDLAVYDSNYNNVSLLARIPCSECASGTDLVNRGTGVLDIRGAQMTASFSLRGFEIQGNYTFTEPFNTQPEQQNIFTNPLNLERLRIGDIASHQLNLVVDGPLLKRLDLNLRLKYVGKRERGLDTTVIAPDFSQFFPGVADLEDIDEHTVVHLTLSSKHFLRNANLQLIVNNLFDEEYDGPGVRSADGITFADRIPQRRRNVYVRLRYRF